jgi:hypothetical protein
MTPWSWDTYDTLIPPVLLLVAFVAASVGLWRWIAVNVADHPATSDERHVSPERSR